MIVENKFCLASARLQRQRDDPTIDERYSGDLEGERGFFSHQICSTKYIVGHKLCLIRIEGRSGDSADGVCEQRNRMCRSRSDKYVQSRRETPTRR